MAQEEEAQRKHEFFLCDYSIYTCPHCSGRTLRYQAGPVAAGVACGPLLITGKDTSESPLKVRGPGSNLADHTLLEVTAGGELIIASGSGNGYRFAEIVGASNPSGWSGCLKVKNPAGVTAGYILLYSNP